MKKILLFLIFLLVMPVAFADIAITTDQSIYNLGNRIRASASVLQDGDFEGLFKLRISCGGYELQYFTTPLQLEKDFRTAIDVPELTVSHEMIGKCVIAGSMETNSNQLIEERQSSNFEATDKLKVLPVNSAVTALPGETIIVAGVVNEAFGNNVPKASVSILFDGKSYDVDAADGNFEQDIKIPDKIKSGKHVIEISVADAKKNNGKEELELSVTPVPSYIKLEVGSASILPGSKVDITASLFDQADDVIDVSLDLDLNSPFNENIFKKTVRSSDKLSYEFSQYAEPGLYALKSTFKNLAAQASVNVSTVREVRIKYGNESVFVENIGNIPFIDELTFVIQNQLKKYFVSRNVEIEPGKGISIDLSKEVPLGIYDIMSSLGIESITFPEAGEFLAKNETIHDNRPAYKKLGSGLFSMSGILIGSEGLLTKNPLVGPLILSGIALLIVFRYGRKPLMKLIRGRKKEREESDEKS